MFDRAFAFLKIVAARVADGGAVLANVRAFGLNELDDEEGEGSNDEPLYTGIGVYSKPLPPNAKGFAEAIGGRREDGVVPLAFRDLRIAKARGNKNDGAQGIAGYNGAFVNIEPSPDGDRDMVQIYVPYEFDGDGVPQKAHGILIDPTGGNESIAITHGDGYALTLSDGKIVATSKNGENMLIVEDAGVSVSGDFKMVTGALAGDVVSAQPVMLATALLTWIGEVNTALGIIAGAAGSNPNPTIVAPVSVPLPSTKLSASP